MKARMGRGNILVVESMGHCFLCLSPGTGTPPRGKLAPAPRSRKAVSTSRKLYSVQGLSRYLEMDMKEATGEMKVSQWKAELCQECSPILETFSGLFHQLGTIDERELRSCLELIQGKLVGGEETINYCNVMDSMGDLEDGWRKLEMLRGLRVEAIQKCSQKLTEVQAQPRVKVGGLTEAPPESPATESMEVMEECPSAVPKSEPDDDPGDDGTSLEISDDEDAEEDPLEQVDTGGGASDSRIRRGGASAGVKASSSRPPSSSGRLPRPKVINQIYTRDPDGQFRCCLCSKKFAAAVTLYKHYRNSHRPKDPRKYNKVEESGKYECCICQKQFTSISAALLHYQKSHMDVKYQCPVPGCDKEFKTPQGYRSHHQTVHRRVRFQCQKCPSTFTQKLSLRAHVNTVHFRLLEHVAPVKSTNINIGGTTLVTSTEPLEVQQEQELLPSTPPKSEVDDDSDYDQGDLTLDGSSSDDEGAEGDTNPDPLEQSESDEGDDSGIQGAGEGVRISSSSRSRSTSSLVVPPLQILNQPLTPRPKMHIRIPARGKYKYKCTLCPKEYTQPTDVNRHYKQAHLKLRVQCPQPGCGRQFSCRQSYQVHHKSVHMGKPTKTSRPAPVGQARKVPESGYYRCSLCPKEFKYRSSATCHYQKTHLKMRRHCPQCDKVFSSRSGYSLHRKTVHFKRGEQGPAISTIQESSSIIPNSEVDVDDQGNWTPDGSSSEDAEGDIHPDPDPLEQSESEEGIDSAVPGAGEVSPSSSRAKLLHPPKILDESLTPGPKKYIKILVCPMNAEHSPESVSAGVEVTPKSSNDNWSTPTEPVQECSSPVPKTEGDDDEYDQDAGTPDWEISDEEAGIDSGVGGAREEVITSSSRSRTVPPPKILNQPLTPGPKKYIKIAERGKYKCILCPNKYAQPADANRHYKQTHLKVRYQCPQPQCDNVFSSYHGYLRHHKTVHPGITFQRHSPVPKPDVVYDQEDVGTPNLENSDEEEAEEDNLPDPMEDSDSEEVQPSSSSHRPRRLPPSRILSDAKTPGGKKITGEPERKLRKDPATGHYVCREPDCDKEFTTPQGYRSHHQTVHEGVRFRCRKCRKLFTRKETLTEHMKEVHLKLREHVCLQCGKDFGRLSNLKCHLKTVHSTSSEEHRCGDCGKVFEAALYLKRHAARVHVQSREFECDLCDKGFPRKESLAQHRRIMHPPSLVV